MYYQQDEQTEDEQRKNKTIMINFVLDMYLTISCFSRFWLILSRR